jgi:hypothetical protein
MNRRLTMLRASTWRRRTAAARNAIKGKIAEIASYFRRVLGPES